MRVIADLAEIFQLVSKHGFGVRMMMAKTVLLSKISIPHINASC